MSKYGYVTYQVSAPGWISGNADMYEDVETNKIYELPNISYHEAEFPNFGLKYCEIPTDLQYSILEWPDEICFHTKFALIEILGEIKHNINSHYSLTNKLRIIKILDVTELFDMISDGETKTLCGDIFYFKNKRLHRTDDKPAILRANGDVEWYIEGKRHRSGNKPALMTQYGTEAYYFNGVRQDEPIKKSIFLL
jgi:hypothetical protein